MPGYHSIFNSLDQAPKDIRKGLDQTKIQTIQNYPSQQDNQKHQTPVNVANGQNNVIDLAAAKNALSNREAANRAQQQQVEQNSERSYQINASPNAGNQLTPEQIAMLMQPKRNLMPTPGDNPGNTSPRTRM